MVKESVEQFKPVFFLGFGIWKESIAGYVADDKYPKRQKTGHKKTTPYSSELLKFFSHY